MVAVKYLFWSLTRIRLRLSINPPHLQRLVLNGQTLVSYYQDLVAKEVFEHLKSLSPNIGPFFFFFFFLQQTVY